MTATTPATPTTQTELRGAFREALVEAAALDAAGGDVGDVAAAIAHAARTSRAAGESPAARCAERLARIALRVLAHDPRRAGDALRRAHRAVAVV